MSCGRSLDTTTATGVRTFCFTCHTTSGSPAAAWDSDDQAYVAVSSTDKVVGIPRDGGVLHLSDRAGHAQGDTQSCYECHGDSYGVGGNNVHNPLVAAGAARRRRRRHVRHGSARDESRTWHRASSGSVSLVATDTGTGVDVTYFTLDGGDLVIGTEVLAASEGTHTVQFWSADAARNVEATNTAVFAVDRTAPVTTTDALASYAGTATITLSATDGADGSGVSATWFRLDGAQEATGSVVTTTTVGEHSLEYWSVDNAGNVEQSLTATFSISVPDEVSLLIRQPARCRSWRRQRTHRSLRRPCLAGVRLAASTPRLRHRSGCPPSSRLPASRGGGA